jgi:hypothetical protein
VSDGFVFLGDGGSAADVAAAVAPKIDKSLVDAKGDLLVGTAADTVGRLAVGPNGQILVPDSSTASGFAYTPRDYNSLTAGEIVPPRTQITVNSIATVSGALYLGYWTADKSEPINTLTMWTGTVAAGATPTLCRMGVYSVAGNGDITLVASTSNDTALFAAQNTAYAKATQAPFAKVAGQRYATAVLIVSGATMPTFHGLQMPGTNPTNIFVRLAPAIVGRVTGQTDLPSPVSAGSIIGYQGIPAMQLS